MRVQQEGAGEGGKGAARAGAGSASPPRSAQSGSAAPSQQEQGHPPGLAHGAAGLGGLDLRGGRGQARQFERRRAPPARAALAAVLPSTQHSHSRCPPAPSCARGCRWPWRSALHGRGGGGSGGAAAVTEAVERWCRQQVQAGPCPGPGQPPLALSGAVRAEGRPRSPRAACRPPGSCGKAAWRPAAPLRHADTQAGRGAFVLEGAPASLSVAAVGRSSTPGAGWMRQRHSRGRGLWAGSRAATAGGAAPPAPAAAGVASMRVNLNNNPASSDKINAASIMMVPLIAHSTSTSSALQLPSAAARPPPALPLPRPPPPAS